MCMLSTAELNAASPALNQPFMHCPRAARCLLQKAQGVFLVFHALTLLSLHASDL